MMALRRDPVRLVLCAAFAVFACRLALTLAVIPPWQHPEEPAQVAFAEVSRSRLLSLDSSDPGRQTEILRSMAANGWWRHYGVRTPEPMPDRFQLAGDTLGIDPTQNVRTTYSMLIAGVLSLLPPLSVRGDLWVMRVLSSVLALLTLWVAWRGARECLDPVGGVAVAALVALHPQFALVSTTAGPDALINLLGALLWWQAVRAVRNPKLRWPLIGVWLVAILAASTDRMGVPLLVSAFIASVFATTLPVSRRSKAALAILVVVAVLGVSLLLVDVFWGTFRSEMLGQVAPVPAAQSWEWLFRFTWGFFKSFWSSIGWERYTVPSWWMIVAAVLAVAAVVGVARRLLRNDGAHLQPVVALAVTMIAVEIAAAYWAYYRLGHGAQGRHMFPSLIPALIMLWVGVEAWAPMRFRQYAVVGLAALFAVLDAVVWALVAVPAYAT